MFERTYEIIDTRRSGKKTTNIRLRQRTSARCVEFRLRVNFVPKVEREFSGIRFVLFYLIFRSCILRPFNSSLFPILYASEADIYISIEFDVGLIERRIQIERSAVKLHNTFLFISCVRFFTFDFSMLSFRWERRTRIMRNRKRHLIFFSFFFGPAFVDRCIANDQLFYGFKWMFFAFNSNHTDEKEISCRDGFFFFLEWRRVYAFGDQLSIDLISECLICIWSRKSK